MARMTHFHGILKRDLFKRTTFLRTFVSTKDVLAAAAAEDYHWRERVCTPMRTLWTFLVQVLNPNWSCRAAVALARERARQGQAFDVAHLHDAPACLVAVELGQDGELALPTVLTIHDARRQGERT